MNCPFCGSSQSSVIDKRAVKSSGEIRRRRECLKCHRRYTTYERVLTVELYVIKRDGRKEIFSTEKLRSGIARALEKRPAFESLDEIVLRIERKIRSKEKHEVESKSLGQAVLLELKKVDTVAYIRFASVYREFKEIRDFERELEHLA